MTQMNLSMKQKQTHRHREQARGCRGGSGGGTNWEAGVSKYKLLYKKTNNKVLLYNTRNYIQYPVIHVYGK